ncbi:MAG: response regulator [Bacteroidota bacterium]|jgi:CheY-like chemotaxis protein
MINDKQKMISELLRNADKVIKVGNYEEAMRFINSVFDLDQKNVYAKAYKERIISLLELHGASKEEAERIAAQAKPVAVPPEPEKPAPPKTPPSAPVVQKEVTQPQPPVKKDEPKKAASESKHVRQIKRSPAALEAYRTLMMDIWKDGSITDEEQARVDSMRDTFAITQDEHQVIEKEVRAASYLTAIRSEWRKGITNFDPLRKKYKILDQEQIAIEPKLFQLLQSLQANGSVLVLDDDEPFLQIVKDILTEGGYYCFTSTSGEEALQLLDTMTPDIVLCDINFTKPNMSGFAFYEKFRSLDKFLTTPFIFLSGLDQEVLIRTGKKLGADDYLTKPIDTEMLLATIEGKLRRSRELRRNMDI